MDLYARSYANEYISPLKSKANEGDNRVEVDTNLGWKAGDRVVITTTDHDDTHTE